MATKIRRNPELIGEDAVRFLRLMQNVEKGKIPKEQKDISKKSLKRGQKLSKKFSFFSYNVNPQSPDVQFCQ